MKGFLLDTNIPSELIRVRPERRLWSGYTAPTMSNCF
jgi:hypothetical protein